MTFVNIFLCPINMKYIRMIPLEKIKNIPINKPSLIEPSDFDWQFYINNYPDLQKNGITNKMKALKHWKYYGKKEGRIYKKNDSISQSVDHIDTHNNSKNILINKDARNVFNQMGIYQIYISEPFKYLSNIKQSYNLHDYTDDNKSLLMFGLFKFIDFDIIRFHKGQIYIMWLGSDLDDTFDHRKFILEKMQHEYSYIKHIALTSHANTILSKYSLQTVIIDIDITIDDHLKREKCVYIYNGYPNEKKIIYRDNIYLDLIHRLPQYKYIFSDDIDKYPFNKKYFIFERCFIAINLSNKIDNTNIMNEFNIMMIPVIDNNIPSGIKWKDIHDVINYINAYADKIDMYHMIGIQDKLNNIYFNIDLFINRIQKYHNILFICGDYPGYGGAATNCDNLQYFFKEKNNTYAIYYNYENDNHKKYEKNERYLITDSSLLITELQKLFFQPDLIILKSFIDINLRNLFTCPIYYLIGGIYKDTLNIRYDKIINKNGHDEHINPAVLHQIKNSDISFSNSFHTHQILKNIYNLDTQLLYSGFIPFYGRQLSDDENFVNRKYDYCVIVSNFNRNIKNIQTIISKMNGKNVILIGHNSNKYSGFDCIDFVEHNNMGTYYSQIKYIIQDSYYESCSNVLIEGLFHGCKLHHLLP